MTAARAASSLNVTSKLCGRLAVSAETISQVDGGLPGRCPASARPIRPVAARPAGRHCVLRAGRRGHPRRPLVICHLCGRSLRSVAAHLAAHGWTKEKYCEAFGLERSQPLEGPETRKLRAAALTARLIFDPAIRAGSAAGRDRARSGDLARDAAAAARGRPFPEQRRRKTARFRRRFPAVIARASRERADRYLAAVAADAARRHGYPDLREFVLARRRRAPAWPPSAARPDCTRTGCRATSPPSTGSWLTRPAAAR